MSLIPIPGLVDLQVNGYLGTNFTDAHLTDDAAAAACRALIAAGTTMFLPTVVTASRANFAQCLPVLARLLERPEFRNRLPGIHLEGPFMSSAPGAVGAHPPEHIQPPDTGYFDELQALAGGHIRMMTIAADQPGAADLCRHATAQGVLVSLGHQLATRDQLAELAAAGARTLTHLGNGLPNQLPRLANPLLAGLACDALHAMIIADGFHLPDDVIKIALRCKGVGNLTVVSDQMSLAGLPPGEYHIMGNRAVLETSGLLHNPDKQCMVGSSQTMLQCMNYLASLKLLELPDLVRVGCENPLALLGMTIAELPASRLAWDTAAARFVATGDVVA